MRIGIQGQEWLQMRTNEFALMTIDGKATRDAKNAQRIRNGCAGHGFVLAVWSR